MKIIADSSNIQCLVNYEDGAGWIEIFSRDISGDGNKFYDGYAGLFFNWNYEPEAQAIDYFKVRSLDGFTNAGNYTVTDSTVTPNADFNGDLTVPVYVTDQTLNSDTIDMTITVNPVNDTPVLNSVTDQTTDEDTPITLDMNMVITSDIDGDSLTIVVLNGDNYSVTDSTVTPDADYIGDLTVPVCVTDQVTNSDTLDMTIIINPVNDAPILSSVTDQTTDEDTPITLDMNMVITSDIDGDSLTIVVLNGDNYSVTDSTVTPDADYIGDLTVPVCVTDQVTNSDTLDIIITVTPVNDAPVLSSVTNQTTEENTPITISISMVTASDVDGDNLSIVGLTGSNYSVTDSTVTPDTDFVGDLTVPVYITDQAENSDTLDMTITVSAINNAPVLSAVTDQTTNKNIPITLDMSMVTASDVDGDALSIVVLYGEHYSVTDSTVTPELDFTGDLTVPVKVTDGVDSSNTVNMTINVSSTGFDDINNSSISIYPNPVKNIINVYYDKEFLMEIYNILGKKILMSKHMETNVSGLQTGIYIILVKDKENKLIKYKKVVKQ